MWEHELHLDISFDLFIIRLCFNKTLSPLGWNDTFIEVMTKLYHEIMAFEFCFKIRSAYNTRVSFFNL